MNASIHAAHMPNTQAVVQGLTRATGRGSTISAQQWLMYAKKCVEPGLNYFQKKFTDELSGSVTAFKAARLFLPHKVDEMKPDATAVDALKAFPFLNTPAVLDGLKQELPAYMAKATDVSISTKLFPGGKNMPVIFSIGLVQHARSRWSSHLLLQLSESFLF